MAERAVPARAALVERPTKVALLAPEKQGVARLAVTWEAKLVRPLRSWAVPAQEGRD